VSSSEQNTTKSQLLSLKEKIDKTVQEYNKAGIPEIPKKLRKDLKDRLTLTWVSSTEGASSTQWRKERAHDVYLQVLNACPHLYVAFISIIAPTACFQPNIGRTVAKLLQLNKETPVRLKLNSEAKEFFRSIAVAGAFTEDPRFVKFICSLFPEGVEILFLAFSAICAVYNVPNTKFCQWYTSLLGLLIVLTTNRYTVIFQDDRPYEHNSSQRDAKRAHGSIPNLLQPSELYHCTGATSVRKCFTTRDRESFRRIHVWCYQKSHS
jgi:hypothetical protein